jgi:hypothetical protein
VGACRLRLSVDSCRVQASVIERILLEVLNDPKPLVVGTARDEEVERKVHRARR